jgi:hypothetical protein
LRPLLLVSCFRLVVPKDNCSSAQSFIPVSLYPFPVGNKFLFAGLLQSVVDSRRLFSSRSRPGSRPASMFTQSRHCGVLRSARYPCQVSVSDSPPRFTRLGAPVLSLPGAADPTFCVGFVLLGVDRLDVSACFTRPDPPRRDCGLHATPAVDGSAARRFLRFPERQRNDSLGDRLRPPPIFPGIPLEGTSRCAQPRGLEIVSRPVSMFLQSKLCGMLRCAATPVRSRFLTARRVVSLIRCGRRRSILNFAQRIEVNFTSMSI